MKIILAFDRENEEDMRQFKSFMKADGYASCIFDIENVIRKYRKHVDVSGMSGEEVFEKISQEILDCISYFEAE